MFVERLWRSIKYEEVYLHAYDSVGQAKLGIARYISFYNTARPHSSLVFSNSGMSLGRSEIGDAKRVDPL